jgi:site-specific recombinase XerD
LGSFRKIPTEAQMKALLEAPAQDTLEGMHDQVLLELLYGTGLRVQECVNTTLPDLDLRAGMLIVHGKGGKVREQPLGPQLTAKLQHYVQEIRPQLLVKENVTALFVHSQGGPMQAHSINVRLRLYSKHLGAGDFSVHCIRHAFATHLLLGGAPLPVVQKLLGHDHISSTTLYTRILPTDVQGEILRTHPRAKLQARRPKPPN